MEPQTAASSGHAGFVQIRGCVDHTDLATSGAVEGLTFFMTAWIQFLRIPAVMADRVCTPSWV